MGKPNELVVYHGLSIFNLDNLSLLRKWHFSPQKIPQLYLEYPQSDWRLETLRSTIQEYT